MTQRDKQRHGATVLECAFVFPVFFLLIVGTIIAGVGVFRYQEIAALAREAARYASVRGNTFERQTGTKAATEKEIYDNVILPKSYALDQSKLQYKVTWDPDKQQGSTVKVELSYRWIPEAYLGGVDLKSTALVAISY